LTIADENLMKLKCGNTGTDPYGYGRVKMQQYFSKRRDKINFFIAPKRQNLYKDFVPGKKQQ